MLFMRREPPRSPVSLNKHVSFFRTPGAGRIIWKVTSRNRFPNVKNGRNDSPACFDHICPLKKRGVADHAIVKKTFVTCCYLFLEVVAVIEVHVDRAHVNDRTRDLRAEMKGNAFVGLNVDL